MGIFVSGGAPALPWPSHETLTLLAAHAVFRATRRTPFRIRHQVRWCVAAEAGKAAMSGQDERRRQGGLPPTLHRAAPVLR